MHPDDFIRLLKTNGATEEVVFLEPKNHMMLYEEAKEKMMELSYDTVQLDFDYDLEPFVFDKYINGNLDRTYKICIFEYNTTEKKFSGKTSLEYCDGKPIFYDKDGTIIKNSLN